MEATGSWLCPTSLDRARVVEASPRVRRARLVAGGAVGAGLLTLAPSIGWWAIGLAVIGAGGVTAVELRVSRSRQPERVAAGGLGLKILLVAVGIALSGGPHSPILSWIAIPAAMAASRFRRGVVVVAAAISGGALLVAAYAGHPSLYDFDPARLFAVVTLLVSVTAVTWALTGAELENRDQAVLDPLTGLLNRKALSSRAAELEQQARMTGESICLLLCDFDHFKAVNDSHGHCRGDQVLTDAAYQLRKALRSFELLYRLGGEEFLVLIPGIELQDGVVVGERLRRAVADGRPGGLELTVSVGVSAGAGEAATYGDLFDAADHALYEAKRAGRNRVVPFDATVLALAEHAPAPAA
jgi:diguanylate cyclase (GGDEF)-like protein